MARFSLINKIKSVTIVKAPGKKPIGVDDIGKKYTIDNNDHQSLNDGDIVNITFKTEKSYGSKSYVIWKVVDDKELVVEQYVILHQENTPYISMGIVCLKNDNRLIFDMTNKKYFTYSENREDIQTLINDRDSEITDIEKVSLAFTDSDHVLTSIRRENMPVIKVADFNKPTNKGK